MTTTSPRTSVSLEHRATTDSARVFADAATRAGRPVGRQDARDIVTGLVAPWAECFGETTRSYCRYQLADESLERWAVEWATSPRPADPDHAVALADAVAAGGVTRLQLPIDIADAVIAAALAATSRPVAIVTARPRVGGAWFAQQLAAALGVPPAPLADLIDEHRPVLVVRHADSLSIAASAALAAADAEGDEWSLIAAGFDAADGLRRGALALLVTHVVS